MKRIIISKLIIVGLVLAMAQPTYPVLGSLKADINRESDKRIQDYFVSSNERFIALALSKAEDEEIAWLQALVKWHEAQLDGMNYQEARIQADRYRTLTYSVFDALEQLEEAEKTAQNKGYEALAHYANSMKTRLQTMPLDEKLLESDSFEQASTELQAEMSGWVEQAKIDEELSPWFG